MGVGGGYFVVGMWCVGIEVDGYEFSKSFWGFVKEVFDLEFLDVDFFILIGLKMEFVMFWGLFEYIFELK